MRSCKARNLAADLRCTVTTDDAQNAVVVDGVARQVIDAPGMAALLDAVNAKYDADLTSDFLDPRVNGTFTVAPVRVVSPTTTSPAARPAGRSPHRETAHTGMSSADRCIVQRVQNLWGLTRRRALDFGRVTTAGC
jgi:hypothetical protein